MMDGASPVRTAARRMRDIEARVAGFGGGVRAATRDSDHRWFREGVELIDPTDGGPLKEPDLPSARTMTPCGS